MGHSSVGRLVCVGLALVILGSCDLDGQSQPGTTITTPDDPLTTPPDDPLTTTPDDPLTTPPDDPLTTPPDDPLTTPPDDPLTTPPSDDSREALYDYCDQATGADPKCWSSKFGNNLRALEHSLQAPDEFGGQSRLEVDGPEGLADAAPVGINVDFVSSTLVGIDFVTDDSRTAGPCRTALDDKAQVGVVTVLTDGPRGPTEIVQAYIIGNPVFRMGRPLSEAAAGLGAPGIGVGSSLADLQTVYPGLEVTQREGTHFAFTPPEEAREQLATTSTKRQMVFVLNENDRVDVWMVGVPQYAANFCS